MLIILNINIKLKSVKEDMHWDQVTLVAFFYLIQTKLLIINCYFFQILVFGFLLFLNCIIRYVERTLYNFLIKKN